MLATMEIKTYYFIGIGGIGMSAIARYLKTMGHNVFGYDRTATQLTKDLESEGIDITYEDDTNHILSANVDLVIYTPAIGQDNNILQCAKDNNMPKSANIILLGMAAKYIGILSPKQLRESIARVFAPKGETIVEMNLKAFDLGMNAVK